MCRQVPSPHASMAACRVAVGMHRALYAHCTSATRCAAAAALVPRAQCLCRAALGDIPRRVQARSEETIHMTPTIGSMKGSCRLMTRGWWPPGRCAVLCVLCPRVPSACSVSVYLPVECVRTWRPKPGTRADACVCIRESVSVMVPPGMYIPCQLALCLPWVLPSALVNPLHPPSCPAAACLHVDMSKDRPRSTLPQRPLCRSFRSGCRPPRRGRHSRSNVRRCRTEPPSSHPHPPSRQRTPRISSDP